MREFEVAGEQLRVFSDDELFRNAVMAEMEVDIAEAEVSDARWAAAKIYAELSRRGHSERTIAQRVSKSQPHIHYCIKVADNPDYQGLPFQHAYDVEQAVKRKQSVTYKNQPAIGASGGSVPLEGTSHVYSVKKLLWPDAVEGLLEGLLLPRSLHACCGMSALGDVRLDVDEAHSPDVVADAAAMPFPEDEFESVLCDPPYNGVFQWNHDLLSELSRVASRRIVFQHWFIPANPDGRYKKAQDKFALSAIYVWQPQTYFGRAQLISVFDRAQ